jgi:hypothetical protein
MDIPAHPALPASNAHCAVLHDAPEAPGRSTKWRAPRPASVAEHCRRRPGRPGVRHRGGRSSTRTWRRDRRSCRLGRWYSVRAPSQHRWAAHLRDGQADALAIPVISPGSLSRQVAHGLSMATRSSAAVLARASLAGWGSASDQRSHVASRLTSRTHSFKTQDDQGDKWSTAAAWQDRRDTL